MIDLDALKARLAEYDDARPRCQGKVARTINCAPDYLPSDDPTYPEHIITTYSPCCRPDGHAGECRNSRLILGWPGFVTVSALVAEVERLRAESAALVQTSADLCPACGWRFLVPGDGCQKCELDKAREERDEMRRWAEEAAHAENLNALDARRERERAVAFLREGDTVCMECGDRAVLDLAYRIECGEHMKDEP